MIVKTFEADSVILKEGDAIQSLYLMKEGTCQVTKRIVTTSPKTGQAKVATVHIGAYNAEDYFGEESLLYHFEHNEVETLSLPSTVTVTAVNGPVHVGVMTLHDALRYIPKELTRSSLTTLFQNPESLLEKYRSDEEQKRWSAMKSRMMDAIVKEKFHDPNMSRAKYHAAISHPQTPFKF